jgi:hypothetical protein
MTRRTLRVLFAAIVAVLSLGSLAEAAGPKKVVRHHPRHSTRVSSGQRAHTTATKTVVARKHHVTRAAASKKKTTAKHHVVKATHKPTTKPR